MTIAKAKVLRYDRRAPVLAEALKPGGVLAPLVALRQRDPMLYDLQFRASAASSWLSFYVGLTTVLDLKLSGGLLHFAAHKTHLARGGVTDVGLPGPLPLAEFPTVWPAVESYLSKVVPVPLRHTSREGAVHGALCSGLTDGYRVIDREAAVSFSDEQHKLEVCDALSKSMWDALDAGPTGQVWWPSGLKIRKNFGTGLDVLAVDGEGRLLIIEAKPATTAAGIVRAPAQVRFYAHLFALWLVSTEDAPTILSGMLEQRQRVGLTPPGPSLADAPAIVPVVAIGGGWPSERVMDRLRQVDEAAAHATDSSSNVVDLELWRVGPDGSFVVAP